MTETSTKETTKPASTPVNDRRKLQNRIAQRRFRQKKAMEARAASLQAEGNWHEYMNIHPQYNAAYSVRSVHDPAMGAVPISQPRGWTHPLDHQDPSMWDNQLFGDCYFLGNSPTDHVSPVAPLSPPSSTSSTSPGRSAQPNDKNTSYPSDHNGHPIPIDSALLYSPAPTDPLPLPTPTSHVGSPVSSVTEQMCAQLRMEMSADWKSHKPGQSWSLKEEPWEPLLHTAARKGNSEIMQLLLDHNADINERNAQGLTALHLALEYRQEEIVMLLLRNGVDVNAADSEGRTALSMAVFSNCEAYVRLFLLHGADPTLAKMPPHLFSTDGAYGTSTRSGTESP